MAQHAEKIGFFSIVGLMILYQTVSSLIEESSILDEHFTLENEFIIPDMSNLNDLVEDAYILDSVIVFVSTIDRGIFRLNIRSGLISRLGVSDVHYITPQYLERCDSLFVYSDIMTLELRKFTLGDTISSAGTLPHAVDRFHLLGQDLYHVNVSDSSNGLFYVNNSPIIPKPAWYSNGLLRTMPSSGLTLIGGKFYFMLPFEKDIYAYDCLRGHHERLRLPITMVGFPDFYPTHRLSPREAYEFVAEFQEHWITRFDVWQIAGKLIFILQINEELILFSEDFKKTSRLYLGDYRYGSYDNGKLLLIRRSSNLQFRLYRVNEISILSTLTL